jgi:hypothetical protein
MNANLQEGDEAYERVEVTDFDRNHKLESFVQGPYRVVENAGNTFRLKIGEETGAMACTDSLECLDYWDFVNLVVSIGVFTPLSIIRVG